MKAQRDELTEAIVELEAELEASAGMIAGLRKAAE
jgi:hypothetical protein